MAHSDDARVAWGRKEEGDELFEKGAWCNKGVSFGLLGWLEEAVECFESAIDINSHHASSWYNKGITLFKLKRDNEAGDALDRARELGFDKC